ncbi:MAG: hypothetical protein QXR30_03800 [Candidatus Woesearchaeota archaeon]
MKNRFFGYDTISDILDERLKKSVQDITGGLSFNDYIDNFSYDIKVKHYPLESLSSTILNKISEAIVFSNENAKIYFYNFSNFNYCKNISDKINSLFDFKYDNIFNRVRLANVFFDGIQYGKNNIIYIDFLKLNTKIIVVKITSAENILENVFLFLYNDNISTINNNFPSIFKIIKQEFNENKIFYSIVESFNVDRDIMNKSNLFEPYELSNDNLLRNLNVSSTKNTNLSRKEMPLENIYVFNYDPVENKTTLPCYSSKVYVDTLSNIKNIDFLKYINTRKIRGRYIFIYENIGSRRLKLKRINIKRNEPFTIKLNSNNNTIIPHYFENNDAKSIFFSYNKKEYSLTNENLDLFMKKTKNYFKSDRDFAKFGFLYMQMCNNKK